MLDSLRLLLVFAIAAIISRFRCNLLGIRCHLHLHQRYLQRRLVSWRVLMWLLLQQRVLDRRLHLHQHHDLHHCWHLVEVGVVVEVEVVAVVDSSLVGCMGTDCMDHIEGIGVVVAVGVGVGVEDNNRHQLPKVGR